MWQGGETHIERKDRQPLGLGSRMLAAAGDECERNIPKKKEKVPPGQAGGGFESIID